MSDAIVSALRSSGMSLYEARIYLGLLRHGPQNGSKLAKSASVPSSKVYAVLDKLSGEGIVHAIHDQGSTTQFTCIAPQELVQRLRRHYNEPLDLLDELLPQVAAPVAPNALLSIDGPESLIATCRSMIDRAEREIITSLWSSELNELVDRLRHATERGVRVYGMLYAAPDEPVPPGSWLQHSYQDIVAARVHGRLLSMVVDRDEAVAAHLPNDGEAHGVRTRSPALVLIISEYLHHDRVLQSAQQKIGFDEWDRWWQADADLRSIILGESIEAPNSMRNAEGSPPV